MPALDPEAKTRSTGAGRGACQNRSGKREVRTSFFEELSGNRGDLFLLIVFRGGWLDGIETGIAKKGPWEWLLSTRYFEELDSVELGQRLASRLGPEGLLELAERLAMGRKREKGLAPRNARQARVIVEGIREYIEGKP